MTANKRHHTYHTHSVTKRGLYSFVLAVIVLVVGTVGFHVFESFSFLDAFYFSSLIATGQGPAPGVVPHTSAGKLFTCLYAFISVGSMIATLGYLFGPFMGRLWHAGVLKLEEELHFKK